MNKKIAQQLVNKTRTDYNNLSDHFSSTRYAFNWPRVVKTIEQMGLEPDTKVLDLGCGNGRAIDVLTSLKVDYTGLDLSENLVNLAKKKYPDKMFLVGDLLKTPFKDEEFDCVLSIATLHHIPSNEGRLNSLKEINRILKPNGKVGITVWYFWDDEKAVEEIEREYQKQQSGKSELEYGDFLKPWRNSKREVLAERYFHAFKKDEMRDLLKKAGFKDIVLNDNKDDKKNNLIATAIKK